MPQADSYRAEKERFAQRNPYVDSNGFGILDFDEHDTTSSYAGPCAITVVFGTKPGQFGLVHLKDSKRAEALFADFWEEWQAHGFEIRDAVGFIFGGAYNPAGGVTTDFGKANLIATKSLLESRDVLPIFTSIRGTDARTIRIDPRLDPKLFLKKGLPKKEKDCSSWRSVPTQELIAKHRGDARRVLVPKAPRVFTSPVLPGATVPANARGLPFTQPKSGIWRSLFSA